jgi:dihydropteroate synthase
MNSEAKAVLSAAGIAVDQDFNSLNPDQLAVIRTEAGAAYLRKHGEPMPADSASYIRKRYDLLRQRACT